MSKDRSSLSNGTTYEEIGEFWDSHSITDFWDATKDAAFQVDIQSEITYYALDKTLSDGIQKLAEKRGISADTILNLWIQEKLLEQK